METSKRASPIATVLRQSHGRQRKGSLRQAAMAKMRERSGSLRKERTAPILTASMAADAHEEDDGIHRPVYHAPAAVTTPPGGASIPLSEELPEPGRSPSHETLLNLPMTGSVGPYASTTDEDDHMSFYRPPAASSTGAYSISGQAPAVPLSRRRSNRSEQRVLASALPPAPETDVEEEWDYSETEWWGWVVLLATWIVFVVGMGSCLGVWSWAWDVGETPYAPPDLEDDDTLPITGYYPALMVCTAVMAWVWVVVAWVGMKYFRHAKVGVDS